MRKLDAPTKFVNITGCGLLPLDTGILERHSPHHESTTQIQSQMADIPIPVFWEFMSRLIRGPDVEPATPWNAPCDPALKIADAAPDSPTRHVIQLMSILQVMACAIMGHARPRTDNMKKHSHIHGELDSGKSTILWIVERFVDAFSRHQIDLNVFCYQKNRDEHTLEGMPGKTLLTSTESVKRLLENDNLWRTIVSNEVIEINPKHITHLTLENYNAMLFTAGNKPLNLPDRPENWKRYYPIFVEYEYQHGHPCRIENLEAKLEPELPGILHLLMRVAVMLHREQRYRHVPSPNEARAAHLQHSDPDKRNMQSWIDDTYELHPDGKITCAEAYRRYTADKESRDMPQDLDAGQVNAYLRKWAAYRGSPLTESTKRDPETKKPSSAFKGLRLRKHAAPAAASTLDAPPAAPPAPAQPPIPDDQALKEAAPGQDPRSPAPIPRESKVADAASPEANSAADFRPAPPAKTDNAPPAAPTRGDQPLKEAAAPQNAPSAVNLVEQFYSHINDGRIHSAQTLGEECAKRGLMDEITAMRCLSVLADAGRVEYNGIAVYVP